MMRRVGPGVCRLHPQTTNGLNEGLLTTQQESSFARQGRGLRTLEQAARLGFGGVDHCGVYAGFLEPDRGVVYPVARLNVFEYWISEGGEGQNVNQTIPISWGIAGIAGDAFTGPALPSSGSADPAGFA